MCRLTLTLVLLAAQNLPILALRIALPNPSQECLEELGLMYGSGVNTSELEYNSTCLAKCLYEKEGKLDSNRNFELSHFTDEEACAVKKCLIKITVTDICKKVSLLKDCVARKTDPYWEKYEKCDEFVSYNGEFNETASNCHHRCQLIVDGQMDEKGNVNISSLLPVYRESNDTLDEEEIIEKCTQIINDKEGCAKDLNMYQCVYHILHHWSPKVLESEFECARKHGNYPFYGVNHHDKSRVCYDRCIFIKTGEINETDLMESNFIKVLNMNKTDLEEAFEVCNMTSQEEDECLEDLYIYDCITYVRFAERGYLQKQKECALETKSPLVSYRNHYEPYDCNTRCLLIKEGHLESDGEVSRTYLEQFSINETIIDEAINECDKINNNRNCTEDLDKYNCATTKVHQKVQAICEGGSCYSRCLMVHTRQITPEGKVIADSFKHTGIDVGIVKQAIALCADRTIKEDECERAINSYYCVGSEIWNLNVTV